VGALSRNPRRGLGPRRGLVEALGHRRENLDGAWSRPWVVVEKSSSGPRSSSGPCRGPRSSSRNPRGGLVEALCPRREILAGAWSRPWVVVEKSSARPCRAVLMAARSFAKKRPKIIFFKMFLDTSLEDVSS
jgi:hypothetical protein